MNDNIDKKSELIATRKAISERAFKIAEAADKKFSVDGVFIGGLGTAMTTIFAQNGGSALGTTFLAGSSAALVASSHVRGTFKKALYNAVALQAMQEAFDIEYREKEADLMDFNKYVGEFKKGYTSKVSSLFNIRSIAIVCAFGAGVAFALTQKNSIPARKEDIDLIDNTFETAICAGYGSKTCFEIKLRTFSPN